MSVGEDEFQAWAREWSGDGPAAYEPGEAPRAPGDRTPPSDNAAEQSVLGSMLLSKDAIADVTEIVKGPDFYRPAHEVIFDAITDLFGRGEPADPVTVGAELSRRGELQRIGGAAYLHTLSANVPIAVNGAYYAQIVHEKAVLRRLVDAGVKIAQLGYAGEGNVDDVVDQAQAEVYRLTDKRSSEDYAPLSDIMDGVLDEIEAIGNREAGLYGVPTGFADLDDLTNGLHAGQMIIVAARPAMGKSTLALDFCRAASIHNNLASCFFSLEMTRSEIVMRLLSAEAKVPLNHIRNGQLSDDDWRNLAKKMSEVSSAPMFIDDSPNMTMMEIRAKARRLKQNHDLKLIVIDYMQLMTSGKKVESRQLEVSEFSRNIKLLAKELELPVIALSQLNRGPEQRGDKKPMMSDLRESGCLTADTKIMRADTGVEVTIGELMASGERDIPVWALDDRLKLVPRTMTHAFPSGVKDVYELTLESGRRIRATANHPFLTHDGWIPLGELQPGARIGSLRHVPPPMQLEARAEAEVREAALTVAAAVRRGLVDRELVPAPRTRAEGQTLLLERPEPQAVPEWVFALPKAQIAVFLRRLWAEGGTVGFDQLRQTGRLSFVASDRRLVDDLARLLLRFNVFTTITDVRRRTGGSAWRVQVSGVENQKRFITDVGVEPVHAESVRVLCERLARKRQAPAPMGEGQDVWDRVRDVLGETPTGTTYQPRTRMAQVAAVLDSEQIDVQATNDVYWDSVASIEHVGQAEVYDATVMGVHNFVAEGIATHNSLEQDADMVILLHREDVYDKESPRLGEADLIVAKHRNGPTRDVTVAFQGHYSRFVDMAH